MDYELFPSAPVAVVAGLSIYVAMSYAFVAGLFVCAAFRTTLPEMRNLMPWPVSFLIVMAFAGSLVFFDVPPFDIAGDFDWGYFFKSWMLPVFLIGLLISFSSLSLHRGFAAFYGAWRKPLTEEHSEDETAFDRGYRLARQWASEQGAMCLPTVRTEIDGYVSGVVNGFQEGFMERRTR